MNEIAAKQNNWIGKVVEDFVIEDRIAEGRFADLYLGTNKKSGAKKVFKVARSADFQSALSDYSSQALLFVTGGVIDAEPNSSQLLRVQAHRLEEMRHVNVVSVDHFVAGEESYYSMEFVEGDTLRNIMDEGPISVAIVTRLLDALVALEKDGRLPHGDLKPENIIVPANGIKLIDPGYSGLLDTRYGPQQIHMTTPAYYPLLKLDDCFAVGIMLWEIATGVHPLSKLGPPQTSADGVGPDLWEFYQQKARVGQHYLQPLLSLKVPDCGDLALQNFLLKAMGLTVRSDGKLDKVECFARFEEMLVQFKEAVAESGKEFFSCARSGRAIEIRNWAGMKLMRLPEGWTEVEGFLKPDGRSLRKFVAPENSDVRICLYLRPTPISKTSAREFAKVLSEPAHKLSDDEFYALEEVIEGAHSPYTFDLTGAATGKINGKSVLTITGEWKKQKLRTASLFTNVDDNAGIVLNIYYSAPPEVFADFQAIAQEIFQAIRWR